MSRRKGRILAFQALYSYDVGQMPLEELLKFEWEQDFSISVTEDKDLVKEVSDEAIEKSDNETYDFARIIISGTVAHLEEIDNLIKEHLSEKWEFERVNKVSLAIIRMSVFALLYQKELPVSVTIDEAVAISKNYGEDASYKFVNGVLDKISRQLAGN